MAMAPEQTGIGIRRHFTTEGVDPYDEVTWERRDARIINYRDGTVAFEQRDVEFPVSWSLNATNIVAQKYFRGLLGSRDRETSLREVIDRVADTVTAWGVKDGYFVDDEESEAFRNELKHLIVNQKASFNSPVWFNIGVPNRPQQASACQPYDALVSTTEGLVPIGRLVETNAVGTKVLDASGVTTIVAVKANGRKAVLRVHTTAGYALDVTADHLVWRSDGEGGAGRFVPAGDLAAGDKLEWHATDSWGNGEIRREWVSEAALAGWLQADGFVPHRGAGTPTIELATVTAAEYHWVLDAVDAAGIPGLRWDEREDKSGVSRDARRLVLTANALPNFLDRWGLRSPVVDAQVPQQVLAAPTPVVAAYLRSLFQAEGFVSTKPRRRPIVGLAMASEGCVRGIQSLLLRFGIFSKIRFVPDRRPDRRGAWVLNITGADVRRFVDDIGFVDPSKTAQLDAGGVGGDTELDALATRLLEVERIESLGSLNVYDIQTESGEYLSGNIRVHNCFILAVEDTMQSILNWYVEEGTIFKGGSGAGINLSKIRSSQESLKGGGTASGPVSFMRGADASAGTIKCLHADTPISTDRGVVPISDAQAGSQVLTRHGYRKIEAVHDNGVRPLVKVTTSLGDEILCTPEHRFRVRSSSAGERWCEAKDISSDDFVLVDLSSSYLGERQQLQPVVTEHHNEIGHSLPTDIDEAFGLWLGWIFGDGSITERPFAKFVAVQLGDSDEELVDRYMAISRSVFGDDLHFFVSRHADKSDASTSVRFSSSQIIRFLEANGLRKGKASALRVPAAVQSSPPAVRAAFIAGLFEADGCIDNGYPSLATVSPGLALDVHRLLLSIGIPSRVNRVPNRVGAYGTRAIHNVRVVGGEGVRRFAKLVGFISERKSRQLEVAMERKDGSPYETQWFLPHVEPEFDVMWEEGFANTALKRAIAPYCRYAKPRSLSLLRARALIDRFPDELALAPFAAFADGNEIYVRATVAPAGEGPTFDLTVEGVHEYLVNNIPTHNSGGTTRRAAKMVVLNADHPDIEDFIWCKAVEERKARVLRDAGFDMDLDGKDSHSTQYQNANNSVRVTDEFMQAVVDDADWHLRAVTTGDSVKTMKARELFRQIAEATWQCADPGMQFDTTINRWHTASNTGRITASNPCFTGDSRVHTDKGLIRFDELLDRARQGETFGIYTHDATNSEAPAERMEISSPQAIMVTGLNEIVRLRFSNGMELRCTPNHKVFTVNRGYVAASELTSSDRLKTLDLPAPSVSADQRLPVSTEVSDYQAKGDWSRSLRLPEKWTDEFSHYLGWLVGHGCITDEKVTTVYGGGADQDEILPRHMAVLSWINGDRSPKPSVQENGTLQLRQTRRVIGRFLERLGLSQSKSAEKTIPWSVEQAPPEAVAAFLTGLFDADGCVYDGFKSRYVGLGSASRELLRGVQRLLTTFGIRSSIYRTRNGESEKFGYVRKDGSVSIHVSQPMYDLRIAGESIGTFARCIGFTVSPKQAKLRKLVAEHSFYVKEPNVRLLERTEEGVELTYNLDEPRNHSYVVDGVVVRNCSEYLHIDNSACNLASLNLLKFLDDDGTFDVDGFKAAVAVMFTAQEILVGNADYPTDKIGDNSRRFRQLGLGYANLGAMLMAKGLPYDSDEGRAWASAITALMTGHAYATSARTATRMGPFAGYSENRDPMNRVLRMHRDELARVDERLAPAPVLSAAREAWDTAVELSEINGVRNSQATVLAPTGCLVGGSLVPTDQGLVRLRSLGDVDGPQWQELETTVATDDGPRAATRFYINGLDSVVRVETARGYSIQGTPQHRLRVVDTDTGEWQWRRFSDLRDGDLVPLALDQLVGHPLPVVLPALADGHPQVMQPALAELVGFFMGAGERDGDRVNFSVDASDFEVVERLERLGKEAFDRSARVWFKGVTVEVSFTGADLALWWTACGFDRRSGFGHLPDALLATNDRALYAAFLRGLFESDAMVTSGSPHWTTSDVDLARDVHSMLLALGYPATCKPGPGAAADDAEPSLSLRLLGPSNTARWLDEIGFVSGRKHAAVLAGHDRQAPSRHDLVPVTRAMVDRLAPCADKLREELVTEIERGGGVPRPVAATLFEQTADPELGRLLSFFYDRVVSAELAGEELTYDISVPDNVTYVANGFISHNTIGLMMDCDTTGIEPDLGLCKTKKLVGGGTMMIVNQTVPRALDQMGYSPDQVTAIIAYIDEHKTILGAPHLRAEHVPVFACSMGDNVIHYLGHVKMMAAVQSWISGAISKCLSGSTLVPTADGLIRIGRLRDDEPADSFRDEYIEVASIEGPQKTDAFYYGGVRPVREVVLRSGHKVTGTPNHRLLVGVEGGLEWKRLDEIEAGDHVATQYGSDMWSSLPARFDDFVPSDTRGRRPISLPTEMSEELAFLLGAYASEGCTVSGSVHITTSVDAVIERVIVAWRDLFGIEPRVREEGRNGRPDVIVHSHTIAEFFDYLGCGKRASTKRIPDAVLRSPCEMVLAFLQGLALDAYVSVTSMPKWAICLDSPELLDDLQAVLTNLGIVHGRISKLDKEFGKTYDEVYATGHSAQQLVTLVPFMEPDKQGRANELRTRFYGNHDTADIVPGITPRELYQMLPYGLRNEAARLVRTEFNFLHDSRTWSVARSTLERVAGIAGMTLPSWLQLIVDDNLHFSPVESVADAGECEVFDLSVPSTHAFVGNGIVNHNTINMPEEATVEEVEQLHIDAWKMGLKAVAIYRDNCKVAQPLSNTKKAVAPLIASAEQLEAAGRTPVREKLPRTRQSKTFSFRVADCHGYVTVGEYDDGRPGEIFLRVAKQGSTLAGIMDAFAISVSHALQYGVPLRAFIDMYTNMRFEPAGMTDDPDLRFASSLVDYIFRRLAVEYLPYEDRAELGILTVGERSQPTLPGVEEYATPSATGSDIVPDPAVAIAPVSAPPAPVAQPAASDAPYCYQCGMVMQRAGACFVCSSCGTTSGCS